jgi:hypothetical protein
MLVLSICALHPVTHCVLLILSLVTKPCHDSGNTSTKQEEGSIMGQTLSHDFSTGASPLLFFFFQSFCLGFDILKIKTPHFLVQNVPAEQWKGCHFFQVNFMGDVGN